MKHGAPIAHLTAKTVAVAFLLSFAVFCGMLFLPDALDRIRTQSPAEADTVVGRERTVALFFRDAVDTLTGAVLLTYDTRTMTMECVGYAPNTFLGDKTLETVYAEGGTSYARGRLGEREGREIDGGLSFSVSGVAAFLIHLQNRLPLTLPEAVGELPAGSSTLTPMQVADILRYNGWTNGDKGIAQMHGEVIAALINRYLTVDNDLEAAFQQLTALCDDELRISQFTAVQEDLKALARENKGAICTVRHAP